LINNHLLAYFQTNLHKFTPFCNVKADDGGFFDHVAAEVCARKGLGEAMNSNKISKQKTLSSNLQGTLEEAAIICKEPMPRVDLTHCISTTRSIAYRL